MPFGNFAQVSSSDLLGNAGSIAGMNLLAIDTTTDVCALAVHRQDRWFEHNRFARRLHNQHVLSMIDSVLNGAGLAPLDLDLIAFGAGPGSFTGVRIGASVSQGIALAANAKLNPVANSAVAAEALRRIGDVRGEIDIVPCIETRMALSGALPTQRDWRALRRLRPPGRRQRGRRPYHRRRPASGLRPPCRRARVAQPQGRRCAGFRATVLRRRRQALAATGSRFFAVGMSVATRR